MQTAAKLVVLLIIVPAAVLIAVYFITEPLVPVVITRQFVSVSVAMCLAGLLVVRTRRPRLGAILVLLGSSVGAVALAALWSSLFATLLCVHALLIITLFTSQSLSRRGVIADTMAFLLRYTISAAILITGPLTGAAYTLSIPLTPDAVAATTLVLLMLYTAILQYYLREPRLGIFNSVVLSLAFGTTFAPLLFWDALNPNIILVGSSFIFFLGIDLVLTSQSLRIIHNLLAKRPAERKRRDSLLQSYLEPMSNNPEYTEPELPDTTHAGEWVVNPYHAHMTSALGILLTALGIPANFLFRAKITGWGTEETFDLLFVPLAILVTLLVLVPSPVFLRLGQSITRHRESFIVHLLGIEVVLVAALCTFEWTQFSLWSLQSSLTASLFLVLAGVTGLFKEVRRFWRRSWMDIVNSFRAMRRWTTSHPGHTGAVVDSLLTWLLVSFLYPTFGQHTRSYLGFLTLSAAIFSLIALVGLAGLKGLGRRMLLAALAWSVLLCTAAGFSFWYMIDIMSVSVVDAASVAALWMLGAAVLLALGIRRRVSAGLYVLGILGAMYQFVRLDLLTWGVPYLVLPIMLVLFLAVPYLYREYKAVLLRVRSAMARVWAAIANSIRGFRGWIGAHPVQTGLMVDSALTLMLVNFTYPALSDQPRSYLGLLALAAAVFSLFALAGVGIMKRLERRMRFAALAWSTLLCGVAAFTQWHLVDVMSVTALDAASVAALWMLGMAAHLKLAIPRRVSAGPYALGVFGVAYQFWQLDLSLWGELYIVPPIAAAIFLGLPYLHREYRTLLFRLRSAVKHTWTATLKSVRAFGRLLRTHAVHTAVVVDLLLTLILATLLYPSFSTQTRSHLGFLTLSGTLFSLFALAGIGLLTHVGRRIWFGALALSAFLCAAAAFSFWYMTDTVGIGMIDAASAAGVWMIGTVGLLRLGYQRRVPAIPYAVGVLCSAYDLWRMDIVIAGTSSAIPLVAAFSLTLPFLHNEYSAALSWLGNALVRALAAFARAARAAAAATYRALARVAAAVYRGIVFIGVLLMKFVLLVYAVLLTAGIFCLGHSVFLPAYDFDPVMAVAVSAALFFIVYTPAVGYKVRNRPHVVGGFVLGLAASVSVFLFLNLMRTYTATPEMSFLASTTVGVGIGAVFRKTFPDRVRNVFPPALCLSFMSYVSAFIFRQALAVQPTVVAAAVAGIPFAVGLFTLGIEARCRRFARTGYAIVIAPSSLIVCYTMFADMLLLPLTVLLALAPVAHPSYIRAAKALALITVKATKALFALILAHLVVVVGMVSAATTFAAFKVLRTWFDGYLYPDLARVVFFALLFIVIWIPSVVSRRASFGRLLSGLLVLLSLLTATFALVWLQPLEAVQTVLIGFALCAFMLTAFSGLISEIPSWRIPLAAMMFSLLSLGMYIVPLEVTLRLLVAAFGTVTIVMLAAGRKVALRLTYPVATATGLGLLFQLVILPVIDPLLAVAMYVCLEALLLCVVKETCRWPLWLAFCVSAGCVMYGVLFPLTQAAIFFACLLGFELLRVTPGEKGPLRFLRDTAAVARSVLVGLITCSFVIGYTTFVLTLALSTLFGLLTLGFYFVGKPKTRGTTLLEDALMTVTAIIIAESVAALLGKYTLISFFAAGIPAAEFLVTRVQRGTYAFGHYCALSAIVVLMASSFWLLFGYSPSDSVPLMLSSGSTATVALYFGRPSSLLTGPRTVLIPITALIASLEVVWIWHAFLEFRFSGVVVLAGAGLVLVSTLLYPASSSLDWLKFEYVWNMTSVVNAVSFGALGSAWNPWAELIPPYPLATLGWCLSVYSLFSTPLSLSDQKTPRLERTAHMNWAPSLVGWPLLVWSCGSAVLVQPGLLLGLTALAFCGAAGVFVSLHPQKTAAMVRSLNIGVAAAVAYLAWESGVIPENLVLHRLALTMIVMYILSFPVTVPLTILAGKRVVRFILAHKRALALFFPGAAGLVVFYFVIQYDAGLILGFQSRQLAEGSGFGMLVSGIGWILARSLVSSAKKAGAGSTFLGSLATMLSVVMPSSLGDIPEVVYLLSACLAASLLLLSGVAIYLQLVTTKRLAHAIGGLAAGVATFSALTHYWALGVVNAVLAAVTVIFFMEAPFLKEQILALLHLLSDLGVLIAAALRRLGAMLKAVFLRFGYVMWTVFSILVVLGVGYLSFPFFSELVAMQSGGPLYVVPSYSMPLMLLGLLFITATAARRKVKTKFGWSGVLTALAGGGLTGITWLLDRDLGLLAAATTMTMISVIVTAANRVRTVDIVRIAVGWAPTPVACGIALISVLDPPASGLSLQVVVIGLSVLVTSILLVASEKINLMPRNMTRYFMVIIAFTSGVMTYASAELASMDFLARVYLSVFVVSWLVLPIARRDWMYLFYAPLFFSLTGFAFTFVFGQLSQSLLLAVAAFLLFITLLVRDREKTRPRLVYLRLALLLLLVGCFAAFVAVSFFSLPAA